MSKFLPADHLSSQRTLANCRRSTRSDCCNWRSDKNAGEMPLCPMGSGCDLGRCAAIVILGDTADNAGLFPWAICEWLHPYTDTRCKGDLIPAGRPAWHEAARRPVVL